MFSDSLNQIAERHPLWTLVLVLRVPLIVVTGYALMVGDWLVEDVAFEAVRYVVLDKPYQLYLIAPLLLLAGFAIRFCGETMIDLVAPSLRYVGGISGFIVWALPGFLAALIGISTGAQFINVAFDKANFGAPAGGFLGMHEATVIAGIAYALVGVLAGALPTRWVVGIGGGYSPVDRFLNTHALTHAIASILVVAAIATFVPFADWTNPAPAQFVGVFGVIALWAFAAVMYFSPLALLAHLSRIPILLLLTVAAFTFSAFNWNDNHEFRTATGEKNLGGGMYFQENLSLESWLRAREKIDLYKYDRYPIFIVAAEGGGLRSAYFTNRVLKTFQTICPTFALHTIAISGVSGGSVGAASFVAQVKDRVRPTRPRPGRPQPICNLSPPKSQLASGSDFNVYGEDHLAALLATALFPDSAQRLLPSAIGAFDRARSIECSFEHGLDHSSAEVGTPCSKHSLRLGQFYRDDPAKISPPYLFLNTTSVNTGAPLPVATRRVEYPRIRSPLPIQSTESVQSMMNGARDENESAEHPTDLSQPHIDHPTDLPLSTAAFLSARFPFVLPPARFPLPKENHIFVKSERLLDGGLFENSGTWYAEQLVRTLLRELQELENHKSVVRDVIREQKLPEPDDALSRAEARFSEAMERVQFFVVVIRSTPCADKRWPQELGYLNDSLGKALGIGLSGRCNEDTTPDPTLAGFSELGSPGRALLNTRVARGHDAQDSLNKLAKENENRVFVDELRFINAQSVHIPLTWSMSRESRRLMDHAVAMLQPENWGRSHKTGDPWVSLGQEGWAPPTYRRTICALILSKRAVRTSLDIPDRVRSHCAQVGAGWDDPPVTPPDPLPALPEVDRCENCDPKPP